MDFIRNDWDLYNDIKKRYEEEKLNSYKLSSKISKLENINAENTKVINDLIKENQRLLNKTNKNCNNEKIIQLYEDLKSKDEQLKLITSQLNFSLFPKEKLMNVIIVSTDQKIHIPIICKNTDDFSRLEKKIYEEYPDYSESDNYFLINGRKINRNKTLDQNKIKNNDVITLNVYNFDD